MPDGNPKRSGGAADEHPFASTRWEWKQVKIRRPAGGQEQTRRRRGRWHWLPAADPRRKLTLTIRYRGGPECWVEIHARGGEGRFPGHVAIYDVMREIWQTADPR